METKARNRAQQDLVEKLRLERTFKTEIRSLFRRMRDDYRVRVAASGTAPIAAAYAKSMEDLLRKHYKRVQDAFLGTVSEFNGKSLDSVLRMQTKQDEEDDTANDLLLLALLEWRDERAPEQSAYITQTSTKDMQESIVQAREILMEEGKPLDNRTVAATAAAILAGKFAGRVDGIATLETQAPAEFTKMAEARSMAGLPPVPTPIEQVFRPVQQQSTKEWRTVGDSKVRDTHRAANRQVRPIDQPFDVWSAQLMFPGDTSLGAPIREVAQCRCSSIYNIT